MNVTQLINQSFNANHVSSFVVGVVSRPGAGQSVDFASREKATAGYRPVLTMTTSGPVNPPPSVATQPSIVGQTATTATLSMLGTDTVNAEKSLTYTWSVTAPGRARRPSSAVTAAMAPEHQRYFPPGRFLHVHGQSDRHARRALDLQQPDHRDHRPIVGRQSPSIRRASRRRWPAAAIDPAERTNSARWQTIAAGSVHLVDDHRLVQRREQPRVTVTYVAPGTTAPARSA